MVTFGVPVRKAKRQFEEQQREMEFLKEAPLGWTMLPRFPLGVGLIGVTFLKLLLARYSSTPSFGGLVMHHVG